MSGKTRSSFLSLVIIAVLTFSAMSPRIVYADDGTPPPDTPPTEVSGGSDEEATEVPSAAPTEETSVPDQLTTEPISIATEVPVEAISAPGETSADTGNEGNTPTEESTTPPATEEAAPSSDASILNDVPEDTTVTVLDSEGQAQPLATQDTADAIAELDPIWCPQGQSPTPGANGCTPSFNNFKALLTFLSGNASYQGAGTIYIQEGVYISGGANDFNDYDLSNISNADLTVTGGWNPATGAVAPGSTSQFRIPLRIGNSTNPWGGSITINNLIIDKSDGTSLVLYTQGDITLSNVNITNAHNNGAGAELNADGNVTINNSNFIRNKKAGAIIKAAGNVSIANSSFSNPTSGRQQITGLDIVSGGSTSLASVTVNGNREVGANINATGGVTIASSFFSGNKAMKGSGPSRTFWGYGLQVTTPEGIIMANVTANDNFLWGASLQTNGSVIITDSVFNANTTADPHFIDDTGLIITSGGTVTLNKVEANDNRLIGANINATGDVNIDSSSFSNNRGVTLSANRTPVFQGYGLQVVTQGSINLVLVNASNNTLFGAHLQSGSDVYITDSNFNNQTSGSATDQTGRGLEIISDGDVFLTNSSINNNQTFGASIQATGNVFLDTITATNNGLDGVDVETSCKMVYLYNGSYSNNGGYGLNVTNTALNQGGLPVFGGNGSGDIFQDPGTCVFPSPVTTNNTTGTPSNGLVSSQTVSSGSTLSSQQGILFTSGFSGPAITRIDVVNSALNNSVNIFMAGPNTPTDNIHIDIFAGKYIYTYTPNGIQVIVLDPILPNQTLPSGA